MAQWMRVLCELTRINSHLIWLGTHALDIGAMSGPSIASANAKRSLKIFNGQPVAFYPYRRISARAHKEAGISSLSKVVETLCSRHRRIPQPARRIPIWSKAEPKGLAGYRLMSLIDLGITGQPHARAAGVKLDARKDCPAH